MSRVDDVGDREVVITEEVDVVEPVASVTTGTTVEDINGSRINSHICSNQQQQHHYLRG